MGTSSSKVLGIRRSTQSVAPRGSDLSVCATEQSQSQSPLQQGERERGEQRKGGSATFSPDVSFQSPSGDDSPIKMYANGGGKEGVEGGTGGGALPGSLRAKHHGQRGTAGAVEEERPRPLADEPVPTAGPHMPEKWQRGDTIGTGSFGSVFIGLNNMTGELLAVKEVAVNVEAHKMKEAVEQLECEVKLLGTLNHPNIVKYVGTLREAKRLYIFLEYVPGGSIASLIQRFGPLVESVIRVYTRQILKGLAYLHASRTVHRDIKGANLLVEKNGRIKLADFGMAKQMVEHMSFTRSFKGSAFWMAPEVIRQRGHGVAADIWSVGCTVLEMATGQPPWSQCSTQVQAIFKIASSAELPTIPETLSPQAAEFILLCLQRDPTARPTADDLLNHPFVALKQGEAEHPTYVASDEYCTAGGPPSAAGSGQPATRGAVESSVPMGALPNVDEGDEAGALRSAFSYSGGGGASTPTAAASSPAASRHRNYSRDRAPEAAPMASSAASSVSSTVSGRPPTGASSLLSPGTPGGTPPKPKKASRAKKGSRSSSSGAGGDENSPANRPIRATGERRSSKEGPVASGECTPRTPVVGEDDTDFASQPAQFRVKGLLGLPPLKLHANTGGANLALPPLDYRPASASGGTPVATPVKTAST